MLDKEKMKLLETIRDRMSGKTLKREVCFDTEGFAIVRYERPLVSIRWADVHEVFALKHDLFSVDEICLGFRIDEAGDFVLAGEDDRGFAIFRAEVERRFPIDPDWFGKISVPPFAQNRTTLWKRA